MKKNKSRIVATLLAMMMAVQVLAVPTFAGDMAEDTASQLTQTDDGDATTTSEAEVESSPFSLTVQEEPQQSLAAPEAVLAVLQEDKLFISFEAVDDAASYALAFVKQDASEEADYHIVDQITEQEVDGKTILTATMSGITLEQNQVYQVLVRAVAEEDDVPEGVAATCPVINLPAAVPTVSEQEDGFVVSFAATEDDYQVLQNNRVLKTQPEQSEEDGVISLFFANEGDYQLQTVTQKTVDDKTVVYYGEAVSFTLKASEEQPSDSFQLMETETALSLQASVADAGIVLSWQDVNAASYKISRATNAELTDLQEIATVTEVGYTDVDALINTDYYYVVEAMDADGVTTQTSETVSEAVELLAPTSFAAKPGDTKVSLTWDAVTNAQSYIVRYGDKQLVTTATTATIEKLNNSQAYTFTVESNTQANGSGQSSEMSTAVAKTAIQKPAVPKDFKVVQGNLQMKLAWQAVAGATSYEVYRYKTATKSYHKVATVTTNTWVDTNIKLNSDYRYKVRAVRQAGGKTAYGSYTGILIYQGVKTVSKVTGLSAKAGELQVALSWKKVTGADGYRVYRYDAITKKYTYLGATSKVTFTDKTAKNDVKYTYKVRAYKWEKQRNIKNSNTIRVFGEYSSTVAATPKAIIPGKVSGVKVTQNKQTEVTLSWSKQTSATGYRIYLYDAKTGKYEYLRDTTSLSYVHKGVTVGQTYQYRVRAYRVVDGTRYYSTSYSSTVSIKVNERTQEDLLQEEALSTVHAIYYNATLRSKANLYSSNSSSTVLGTISSGSKVTVLYRTINSRSRIKTSSGSVYYVKSSNLNVTSAIYKANAYSDKIAQAFVNAKGYSSNTNYLVWLSTYSQRVFIFTGSTGNWKLARSAPGATGKVASPTPHGNYKVEYRESRWNYAGGYHVNKPVTFTIPKNYPHGNAFHSRIYWNSGSLKDGTMSKPASNGCIRMYDSDISYIHSNVKTGSKVISY